MYSIECKRAKPSLFYM